MTIASRIPSVAKHHGEPTPTVDAALIALAEQQICTLRIALE